MPSCGAGTGGIGENCAPCKPGTYSARDDIVCHQCPKGKISANYHSTECTACVFPHTTYNTGSDVCSAFSFNTGNTGTLTTAVTLTSTFLICLYFAGDYRKLAFILMALPMMDYISDILYVQQSLFYNFGVFICGCIFIFMSNSIFTRAPICRV